MRHRRLALALRAVAALAVTPALAFAQVHFTPLAGGNGAAYTGHTENGFDVAATGGSWFEAHIFGNPVPSVFGGPIGSPTLSSLFVTRSGGGTFTFASVDLVSQNGRSAYEIVGYSGLTPLFTMTGFIGAGTVWQTVLSSDPATLIDGLSLAIDPVGDPTSFNVDNIMVAVSAVPEPATILLTAGGLVVLAGVARRRRTTA